MRESISNKVESREFVPMFRTITEGRIESLVNELSENTGVDFTGLPIDVVGPGDPLFDMQEAQTKLYVKAGSWQAYKDLLDKHNLPHESIGKTPGSIEDLRRVAREEGVILDDAFEGFIYNLGGMKIMYVDIREDKVIDMANKYARKEQENFTFEDLESAKEFIRALAEKYFSHEVGHTVYMHVLSQDLRQEWDDYVDSNPSLRQRVIDLQIDKHPTPESIPVGNEAFADIFSEIATKGKSPNRLGKHEDLTDLLRQMLIPLGFKL